MSHISKIDYSILDQPEILMFLFHPRKEGHAPQSQGNNHDILIPVEDDTVIGARFHLVGKPAPNILFFHGNGEIVSDYDDLGPTYVKMGINFLPVDYRGYGNSTGNPTVTAMMKDCHAIFTYVQNWLRDNDYTGPFVVMGRSLGSASVLELAANYKDRIDGLIIESGFAYIMPLLKLLGINVQDLGISKDVCFYNIDKIKTFNKPTLIIHAENDHIIPFSDGKSLYQASPAPDKRLLMIPGANHNDIFLRGFQTYMKAIQDFLRRIS
jgi:hypothetical protein